jgi:hypothetical protein
MAGLGAILAWQFRNAPEDGWSVTLDDNGVAYISTWNEAKMGRTMPTGIEIQSWNLPATKYFQRRNITRSADNDYEAVNSIEGDVISMYKDELLMDIVANRLSPAANPLNAQQTSRRNQMASIRASHRNKMTAIDAAITVAAVEAVTWP